MASKRENVVKVLLYVATDLEDRQYGMAGVLRQLAREVAQMNDGPEEGRCRCGAPIIQPRTGRPRKSCTICSQPRKTLRKRDAVGRSQSQTRSAA